MARITSLQSDTKKQKITKVGVLGFKTDKCLFYECLRRVLRSSRWLGFFPIQGLDHTSISSLRYTMRGSYGFYVTFSMTGQIVMTLALLYIFLSSEFSVDRFSHLLFYLNALVSSTMLLRFARHFPHLAREIADFEICLTGLKMDKNVPFKIIALSSITFSLALVEHILSVCYAIYYLMLCVDNFNLDYEFWQIYFLMKLPILPTNEYSLSIGIILEITIKQATFLWTYVDVLIMSTSLYLVYYFKSFNKLIELQKANISTDWKLLRTKFSHLVGLVNKVDSHMSMFMMQSFFTNLVFTCLQLFNTIRHNEIGSSECSDEGVNMALQSFLHVLYYTFSFTFLILRTLAVSLLAADVNSNAHQPISALGEIHASSYNLEIQRFYRQLSYNTIGLSGVFFYVTRKMILKVLGTLVTYELMLLQFQPQTPTTSDNITEGIGNTTTSVL